MDPAKGLTNHKGEENIEPVLSIGVGGKGREEIERGGENGASGVFW